MTYTPAQYNRFRRLVMLTGSLRNDRRVIARLRINAMVRELGRPVMDEMWAKMKPTLPD